MERRDLLHRDVRPFPRASGIGGVSLVQAAMRRRLAERAFEDYVREMARRWNLPPQGGDPGASDALPKV